MKRLLLSAAAVLGIGLSASPASAGGCWHYRPACRPVVRCERGWHYGWHAGWNHSYRCYRR